MKVAIIGGGAAGFFSAIHAKEHHPEAEVCLLEKTNKLLAKVKISGGGRCNVTNACTSIKELSDAYPRGGKFLKQLFKEFSTTDTRTWFESRDVPLMVQEDQCIFPVSQDSQSIIDCLLDTCRKLKIKILTKHNVETIERQNEQLVLGFMNQDISPMVMDKVILATGGAPKRSGLAWLEAMGHQIADPVPSLFTFNMPRETITELMGVVVNPATVSIQGKKLKASGPLLITHWGMSGPAILKLSAFGARTMQELNYRCVAQVNWVNVKSFDEVLSELHRLKADAPKKQLNNQRPYLLPIRLWEYLLQKADLALDKPWHELGSKSCNRLVTLLINDEYQVSGKTTFKEEFVTCGGVSLSSIHPLSLESRVVPGLYFAGELLDIDGITGGYNFQAAWTTGYIAGQLRSTSYSA